MRKLESVASLETFGRVQLSNSFFMRDFLHSEIANFYGIPNIPDDPELAIEVGRALCQELLEPLQERFGRISIRSAYRSCTVNAKGNEKGHSCAANEKNYAGHIWDRQDANGKGATACIVVNSFVPYFEDTGHWEAMAWWVHDQLPYSYLEFFPKRAAFNISWHEQPARTISSQIPPRRGLLTRPGWENYYGDHEGEYRRFLAMI